MMMKIFGAVLIVSGGYLLGRVRTLQQNKRIKSLRKIRDGFEGFERKLSEYRVSAMEYFEKYGPLGEKICGDLPINGLILADRERLSILMETLKKSNYQDALENVRNYLKESSSLIKALEEEAESGGKALPLVTGTIGFLVAVFLF